MTYKIRYGGGHSPEQWPREVVLAPALHLVKGDLATRL
ncbi:hypothetical protein HDC93_003004 [Streptomyces sp. AK010]|nr:hypothetical protein [Streptomyces sp. AK010]